MKSTEMFANIFHLNKTALVLDFMLTQKVGHEDASVWFWYSDQKNRDDIFKKFDMCDPAFRDHLKKILKFKFMTKVSRGCYIIEPRIVQSFKTLKEIL